MPQTILKDWKPTQGETTMPEYTLDGWRALPMPRISSDVKGNFISMNCAFINPYSKNKERALKYLEAITEAPFDFITGYTSVMFFKDKSMYADKYDITQPAFEDIYNIISNGMFKNSTFFPSDSIITDYQSGKLTLDEAVAAIQREAEMWLNE
jgi:hypothetical protein